MIGNFFKNTRQIFSVYPPAEAPLVFGNYLRIIIRNRLPFILDVEGTERQIMVYAHRPV